VSVHGRRRLKSVLLKQFFQTIILIIVTFSFIPGCAVGPNFHEPSPPQVSRYTYKKLPKKTTSVSVANAGKSQILNFNQPISKQWWYLFHSAVLNCLVQQGLRNNPTLEAAKKSLQVAQQTLRAQMGNLLLPAVDLNLSAERTRIVGLQYGVSSSANVFNIYNTQTQASYMLDLFGGNRRQVEFYQAQVDYKNYERLAAYLTLTSNITTTAITISSLEAQIKATLELIKTERDVLNIKKMQFKYGGVSQEEIEAQTTLLAQTIALLPPLQKTLAEENHSLAVLLGSLTSNTPLLHLKLSQLNLPARLPVSLPSQLVRQRPDILAAEALLHAMSAKIGVATGNLLPKITLNAYYGWVANSPASLFMAASNAWLIGSSLLQPLFHGGALIAERRAAIAEFQEYYFKYQNIVLQAFKEVADALRSIQLDAYAFKAEVGAEQSSKKFLATSMKRFKFGGENYLNVLIAQQKYLTNKINRIKAQASRYTDTVTLFQALGGGWWNNPAERHSKTTARRGVK